MKQYSRKIDNGFGRVFSDSYVGMRSATAIKVHMVYSSNCSDDGFSWVGVPSIASKIGVAENKVRAAIKILEDAGLLEESHINPSTKTKVYAVFYKEPEYVSKSSKLFDLVMKYRFKLRKGSIDKQFVPKEVLKFVEMELNDDELVSEIERSGIDSSQFDSTLERNDTKVTQSSTSLETKWDQNDTKVTQSSTTSERNSSKVGREIDQSGVVIRPIIDHLEEKGEDDDKGSSLSFLPNDANDEFSGNGDRGKAKKVIFQFSENIKRQKNWNDEDNRKLDKLIREANKVSTFIEACKRTEFCGTYFSHDYDNLLHNILEINKSNLQSKTVDIGKEIRKIDAGDFEYPFVETQGMPMGDGFDEQMMQMYLYVKNKRPEKLNLLHGHISNNSGLINVNEVINAL